MKNPILENSGHPSLSAVVRRPGNTDILDLFVIKDGLVHRNTWEGSWQGWLKIPKQHMPFAAGSPMTAVSRTPGQLDIFVLDYTDGNVFTVWWNGAWGFWGQLPLQTMPFGFGSPLAVVSRNASQLDVFVLDYAEGYVCSTWWHGAHGREGSWSRWGKISPESGQFSEGSQLAAVSRDPERLDLFVLNSADGLIYTNWYVGGETGWAGWHPITMQQFGNGSPIAAMSRSPSQLDVFVLDSDGVLYTNWWNSTWGDWGPISPRGISFGDGSHVAAISRDASDLEVFVSNDDGLVYTNSWNDSWGTWTVPEVPDRRFGPRAAITTAHLEAERLGLFAFDVRGDGQVWYTEREGKLSSWASWKALAFPADAI